MKKRGQTVRLCAAVFLLMTVLLLFAAGVYTVDAVSGRLLHGSDYRPALSLSADLPYLPARWRVLWAILCGEVPF